MESIGIRRAIGARRADIQNQFLIESVMLSLAGGAVGLRAGSPEDQGSGWAVPVNFGFFGQKPFEFT